ncbi:N-glycosylase/DNA lyase [Candidatus Woesearchaeota archaeon]|nr:N-glycosylase/DNA lyase [Candidatus Woesearchaeota archaeon]
MKNFIKKIKELEKTPVKDSIKKRLTEFSGFKNKPSKDWFSELCFCLLTANWKAKESIEIQKELCKGGFCNYDEKKLADYLKKKGHRFWPQRAKRICLAREHIDIKEKIFSMDEFKAREWLVENIHGLGYKEASHFLRNVGYFNLAILDRHILNLMLDFNLIKEKPKTLTKKKYLEIENILKKASDELSMSLAELDLYMFYIKTGEVLK